MPEFTQPPAPPSLDEVNRIATYPDPVIRNLQITHCYHELSSVLAKRTGPIANWCTFATWASKQAGQSIRQEDFKRALETLFTAMPATQQAVAEVVLLAQEIGVRRERDVLLKTIWEVLNPLAALERASDAVARGNQKVFAEIGYAFARFEAECLHDATFDGENIARFCESLRDGDPPEGQRYLRQAFACYYQAFFEPDPKIRAELLLLANVEIGFHEQTRLQPEIAEALDASIMDPGEFVRRVGAILFPYRGWAVYLLWGFMRLLNQWTHLDEAITHLLALARQQVRLLLTETLMGLEFPDGIRLRLGDDLHAAFPMSLKQLTHPDLCHLMERIDPTPDSLHETGALDWADLPDRLHFIVDLFRCYEETASLLSAPFTPTQTTDIKAGRLPSGRL